PVGPDLQRRLRAHRRADEHIHLRNGVAAETAYRRRERHELAAVARVRTRVAVVEVRLHVAAIVDTPPSLRADGKEEAVLHPRVDVDVDAVVERVALLAV